MARSSCWMDFLNNTLALLFLQFNEKTTAGFAIVLFYTLCQWLHCIKMHFACDRFPIEYIILHNTYIAFLLNNTWTAKRKKGKKNLAICIVQVVCCIETFLKAKDIFMLNNNDNGFYYCDFTTCSVCRVLTIIIYSSLFFSSFSLNFYPLLPFHCYLYVI